MAATLTVPCTRPLSLSSDSSNSSLAAQDVAAEFVVQAPGFGELDGPGAAIQELDPQQTFGFVQVLAGGGLAHAADFRAVAHVAGVGDVPEKLQMFERHTPGLL